MYHKANLNRIMAEYTGQPIEKVRLGARLGGAGMGRLRSERLWGAAAPRLGSRSRAGAWAGRSVPGWGLRGRGFASPGAQGCRPQAGPAVPRVACVGSALPPCLPTHPHPTSSPPQIEEDTDRDRYMSPLEAKAYGLIDHIVGGEEAVFKVGAGRLMRRSSASLLLAASASPAPAAWGRPPGSPQHVHGGAWERMGCSPAGRQQRSVAGKQPACATVAHSCRRPRTAPHPPMPRPAAARPAGGRLHPRLPQDQGAVRELGR